jgi:hypothetical protein
LDPRSLPVPVVDDRDRFHDFALPLPVSTQSPISDSNTARRSKEVLPYSLADYDVTGTTGTGKTAAFLLTILAQQWERPQIRRIARHTARWCSRRRVNSRSRSNRMVRIRSI